MAELKAIRPEVDEDVLKTAEEFLTRVRSGETTGFMVLEQKRDVISYSCTRLKNRFELMGYLMHAICKLED